MPNDSKNLLIPHGWLKAHATLPALQPNLAASYTLVDFGQFERGVIRPGGDLKDNFTGLNGIIGLDKRQRVKATLTYEFDAKYFPLAEFERLFGSASGGAPAPGKVVDLFCWMGMQAEGEKIQSDGTGLFVHHSFKAGVHYEGDIAMNGDDYVMCKLVAAVYLGSHPGVWFGSATRPVPVVP
ncbi:MAG TPA: hypothetical protein VEC14_07330 [Reyranellaceae bacterium]|nr:hypothetical protein [Reyranellaceae bacterium]